MFPASFDESNLVLDKPDDMTHDQCDPLSVFRGNTNDGLPVVISCWKCTAEELKEIQRTGRVWVMVYGITMPPIAPTGIKPFE